MSVLKVKEKAFANPQVKEEYDALEDEWAKKRGIKAPNISRLESGKQNTSLKTMFTYAKACGFKLKIDVTDSDTSLISY